MTTDRESDKDFKVRLLDQENEDEELKSSFKESEKKPTPPWQ